eukprot:12880991-Prorocentrum_lima.AAC.1
MSVKLSVFRMVHRTLPSKLTLVAGLATATGTRVYVPVAWHEDPCDQGSRVQHHVCLKTTRLVPKQPILGTRAASS